MPARRMGWVLKNITSLFQTFGLQPGANLGSLLVRGRLDKEDHCQCRGYDFCSESLRLCLLLWLIVWRKSAYILRIFSFDLSTCIYILENYKILRNLFKGGIEDLFP